MSSGVEGSAVELNRRIRLQSNPSIVPSILQARTSLGTTPSIVTPATETNSPKGLRVVLPT